MMGCLIYKLANLLFSAIQKRTWDIISVGQGDWVVLSGPLVVLGSWARRSPARVPGSAGLPVESLSQVQRQRVSAPYDRQAELASRRIER
jgi:hypothetical protein